MTAANVHVPSGPLSEAMLKEAELKVSKTTLLQSGRIREIDRSSFHDHGVAIRDSSGEGIDIVLRVAIPPSSELRRLSRASDQALALLGRLTDSLIGSRVQAELQSDATGLQGVLLLRHICRERLDAAHLAEEVSAIEEIGNRIKRELASDKTGLLDRLDVALRPDYASESLSALRKTAAVVPTFDPGRRAQLMALKPTG